MRKFLAIAVLAAAGVALAGSPADATKKKKRYYPPDYYPQTYRYRDGLTPAQYSACRRDQILRPTFDIYCGRSPWP